MALQCGLSHSAPTPLTPPRAIHSSMYRHHATRSNGSGRSNFLRHRGKAVSLLRIGPIICKRVLDAALELVSGPTSTCHSYAPILLVGKTTDHLFLNVRTINDPAWYTRCRLLELTRRRYVQPVYSMFHIIILCHIELPTTESMSKHRLA